MQDNSNAAICIAGGNALQSKSEQKKSTKKRRSNSMRKVHDDHQSHFPSKSKKNYNLNRSHFERATAINRQTIIKTIGVIKSIWLNKKKQVINFSNATAFLLSNRLLMTSGHNIYSQYRKKFANHIQFFPNISEGTVNDEFNQIRRVITLKPLQNLFIIKNNIIHGKGVLHAPNYKKSRQQEICLIVLPQGYFYSQEEYISIGELSNFNVAPPRPLSVIGYSFGQPRISPTFIQVSPKRHESDGYFHSVQKLSTPVFHDQTSFSQSSADIVYEIIHHTAKTQVGMSGSPILAANPQGKLYAIGMHTHSGYKTAYNTGVYFDRPILEAIKQLQSRIFEQHFIAKAINYHYQDGNQAQEELQKSRKLRTRSLRQQNVQSIENSMIQSFESQSQSNHSDSSSLSDIEQMLAFYTINPNNETD